MSTAPFLDTLRHELEGMHRLSAILAEEFAGLGSADPDVLDQILRRKAAILDDLQDTARSRAAALAAAGVEASATGVESWLHATAGAQGAKLWTDLLAQTRAVHDLHRTNTALLEGLMRHNRQSLDLLTRLASPDLTYGADGSTSGSFGTRNRGRA